MALGQRVEVGDAPADAADELLDGSLAVRRAEHARPDLGEVGELLGSHLRWAAAESAVGGQE